MKVERTIEYFRVAVEKVKSFGYRCYGRNDRFFNYCFITDGKHIGYMQSSLSGIDFSTVHIGTKGFGSGFASKRGLDPFEITEDVIKMSFSFSGGNDWAYGVPVKKYQDWEHFVWCKRPFSDNYKEL